MLLAVTRFELRYHLRRPVTWIYFGVVFLLAFAFISTDAVQIAGTTAQVHENSPATLNWSVMILTIVGTVITSAIAGTAILRDFELKAHELLFTTPIPKSAYVGGRFLGAVLVTLVAFAGAPLGLLVGAAMPWIDPSDLGPVSLAAHVWPYLIYTVPNTILACALFFAVGVLTRSLFAVYVQGMALFIGYNVAMSFIGQLESETLGALVDPFGIGATTLVTRDWTIAEKNSLLVSFEGLLLDNRLLWLAIAGLIFAGAYRAFGMDALGFAGRRRRKAKRRLETAHAEPPVQILPTIALPTAPRRWDGAARLGQLLAMTWLHFRATARSVLFLAICAIGMIFMITIALNADALYGTRTYPVTYQVAEVVTGTFTLFFFILTTLYTGELVWRERGLRCDQIHDALPVPSGLAYVAKILALLGLDVVLLLVLMATGIMIQAGKGFFLFEPMVYLGHLFGLTFPWLVLITLLSFAVHAIVGSKFIGHVVVLLVWIAQVTLGLLDFDHLLWGYGKAPEVSYSQLNGFGPNVGAFVTLTATWFALGLTLSVVALLLLQRGTEGPLRARLRAARARLDRGYLAFGTASFVAFLGLAGYVVYNTNVLHTYRAGDTQEALRAAYEREYRPTKDTPQPRIVGVQVDVDLFPERGHYNARGTLALENRTDEPVELVYVNMSEVIDVDVLEFDRPATLERLDERFALRTYRFAEPLPPGAKAELRFEVAYRKEGFGNGGRSTAIVDNGSFVHSTDFLPQFGYQEGIELSADDKRREQGLAPKERMAPIDDMKARMNTYIVNDSDWIDFESTVSTVPDQVAIAPGYLQREWEEGGRRYFHYKMDAKILNFFSYLSARYEIKRDRWNDVAIEIYYDPAHPYNVDRMIDAVKKSLDYYTTHFSPYQHRQVRILEFPRYASYAQAFPNTVPYSESIGFIARIADPDEDLDYPFYVTAHEVAHQWWAHQVIGGDVQGATVLTESLSQYSALMVMEKEYGAAQMHKFLEYELRRYLQGRSGETKKEMPLALNENQPYIHYNKASLVFYALKDYVGEDVINQALARLLREHAFEGPPFATSRDLVKILRELTPPDLHYLIDDSFESIVLYDNKVKEAAVTPQEGGRFAVKMVLQVRKLRATELGDQSEAAMDDLVDVGVFAPPGPGEGTLGKPLFLEKRRLKGPEETIEVVVDAAPSHVGVDPYHKLIDRQIKDNVKAVGP
ncbi:MAG: M1 family aminopeptidase [Nannocystaceae bacterium]